MSARHLRIVWFLGLIIVVVAVSWPVRRIAAATGVPMTPSLSQTPRVDPPLGSPPRASDQPLSNPPAPGAVAGQRPVPLAASADVSISAFTSPAPVPATLTDYWNGKAHWSLTRTWTQTGTGWNSGFTAGDHIEILNGTWYLFSRKYYTTNCVFPSGLSHPKMGIEVRQSTDAGQNWSAPQDILVPTTGTPWVCGATDGDAYYDAGRNKWHYLFQCWDQNQIWRGCYAERAGTSPMGPFTARATPVIQPGALWNAICNQSTDDCVSLPGATGRVHDEGTFDIFLYDGTYFWVDFHGYDGVRGYRGIAKTADFITWISGDPNQGVPTDAIVDAKDGRSWRESWASSGAIGAGAGSILDDQGYYYLITEIPDVNLGCTDGQNWDWGIFRTSSLASTSWEQYPLGNPIMYSSKALERNGKSLACNLAYGQLFRDPATGFIYMKISRESLDNTYRGIYLYRLEPTTNRLKNGDAWMGEVPSYWQRFNGSSQTTNLTGYRFPNGSSDGNQYIATNCGGATCQPGQSIYQDVSAAGLAGRRFEFSGKFRTDAGSGSINMVVFQLDSNYAILQTHQVALSVGTNYALSQGEGVVLANTATLRYQLYLQTGGVTFRADEMYLGVPYTWTITARLACPSGTTLSQTETARVFYALWPPNPLVWNYTPLAFGNQTLTLKTEYTASSAHNAYFGMQTSQGWSEVLTPVAPPPNAAMTVGTYFSPPTPMVRWQASSLPDGSYTLSFWAPTRWCR